MFCDHNLPDKGWTVIQRRVSDDVSFDRYFLQYKHGFGDLCGSFWLGLDKIYSILHATPNTAFELFIGLESFAINTNLKFARYDTFDVGPELGGYVLKVDNFNPQSTANDAMAIHDGQQFSAKDNDNDFNSNKNCAQDLRSGWWHNQCLNTEAYSGWP